MNDKKINYAKNRDIYLLNTAKLITNQMTNQSLIVELASNIGIAEGELIDSLNNPTKNPNIIVAAKGHIKMKTK